MSLRKKEKIERKTYDRENRIPNKKGEAKGICK
jgi:hypothetical protein